MRFSSERALVEKLFRDSSPESIVDHPHESDQAGPYHRVIFANGLRLTPLLAPQLFGVLDGLRSSLGFEEATDLFVFPRGEVNAFALHRLDEASAAA